MFQGSYEDRFAGAAEAFGEILAAGELGAALCVHLDGVPVIDVWGGYRDLPRTRPWARDTLVCMMSVNKGLAALCAHLLVADGALHLDAMVADYWPEFASSGKGQVSVRALLGHRAGLVFTDGAPRGALFDQPRMAAWLASTVRDPAFVGRGAYHTSTYGVLVSELVRRVSGIPIADVFRERICLPLEVDYHFAIRPDDEGRVSDIHVDPGNATVRAIQDPMSPVARAWAAAPDVVDLYNDLGIRRRGFASGAGMGNARAVSRLFMLLERGRILPAPVLADLCAVEWDGCALSGRAYRMGLGLLLNSPDMPMGPSPRAFGHAGAGGSIAFADPDLGLSFAYSPNTMAAGEGVGPHCARLIQTVYRALEGAGEPG